MNTRLPSVLKQSISFTGNSTVSWLVHPLGIVSIDWLSYFVLLLKHWFTLSNYHDCISLLQISTNVSPKILTIVVWMRCAQTQKAHMYAVARKATRAMVLFAEVNLGVLSEMLFLQTRLHLIQFYTQWNKWPMLHFFLYQVHFSKII